MANNIQNINFQSNNINDKTFPDMLIDNENTDNYSKNINYKSFKIDPFKNNPFNDKVEEINLELDNYNNTTKKTIDGVDYIYNRSGHLIRKIDNKKIIYEEYSSGKVKVDNISGWRLEFNPDGTIKKIKDKSSYLYSNKSYYKKDSNGDIIIYDKEDENKIYMKLTKDGNMIEKYSADDEYIETRNYVNELFNDLISAYGDGNYAEYYDGMYRIKKIRYGNNELYVEYFAATNNIIRVKFPDGTEKAYNTDHSLYYEKLFDGTEKAYYEDGNLMSETFLDGTEKAYYEDGSLMSETFLDGSSQDYYHDGTIKKIMLADKTYKVYNYDGNVIEELTKDGLTKTYYEDGNLHSINDLNGNTKYYTRNQNLDYTKYKDGSIKYGDSNIEKESHDSNDNLTYQLYKDGTEKKYYSNGNLMYESYKDGTEKYYDEDGSLYEIKKDNKVIEYLCGRDREDMLETPGYTLDIKRHYECDSYEVYDDNGKLIASYKNRDCEYLEYPSGQVRVNSINGIKFEYKEDGTITRFSSFKNYEHVSANKYKLKVKLDNNNNIILYDINNNNRIVAQISDKNNTTVYSYDKFQDKEICKVYRSNDTCDIYENNILQYTNYNDYRVGYSYKQSGERYIYYKEYYNDKYIYYNENGDVTGIHNL